MQIEQMKNVTVKKFRSFCKHSTLHGMYYFYQSRSRWVHSVWTLVVVCSAALCGFLSHMIWLKYTADPTFTVVESTQYSTAKIPFPAVTACDTEAVYGPNTANISDILRRRGFDMRQIEAFYQSFTLVKQSDYVLDPDVVKMHTLLQGLGLTLQVLLRQFRKPCDELLLECTWRSKPYNCSDMFREVYTIVGHCCQFDMAHFRRHVSSGTSLKPGVDSSEALEVIVNGHKVSYNGSITHGYILMYVFDDKDSITLVDSPITLTPSAYFDINIYLWLIDASPDVEKLSLDNRKCLLEADLAAGASFYNECITKLILAKAVRHCRCMPFNLPSRYLEVGEYGACTFDRLVCIHQTIDSAQAAIRELRSDECLQKCNYVHYNTEIEYIRNQRPFSETRTQRNGSYSRAAVHFNNNKCLKYKREVLYTWDQMLANLGGIFGLCLGGSIISIIELVWFVVDVISSMLQSFRRSKTTPLGKKQVYTLTQKDLTVKRRKTAVRNGPLKFVH